MQPTLLATQVHHCSVCLFPRQRLVCVNQHKEQEWLVLKEHRNGLHTLTVSSWRAGALLTIGERDGEDHADVYIYGPSGYQCKQAEIKAKSVTGMDISVSRSWGCRPAVSGTGHLELPPPRHCCCA